MRARGKRQAVRFLFGFAAGAILTMGLFDLSITPEVLEPQELAILEPGKTKDASLFMAFYEGISDTGLTLGEVIVVREAVLSLLESGEVDLEDLGLSNKDMAAKLKAALISGARQSFKVLGDMARYTKEEAALEGDLITAVVLSGIASWSDVGFTASDLAKKLRDRKDPIGEEPLEKGELEKEIRKKNPPRPISSIA